ncbi:ankyrin repeat-containing protein BDA1 [Ricinus communis]|uniref:Protein binding protein, putative n=1 Tax=Ricinus communis TaxID=3988 RepID=B9S5T4_RICCO|nr:ankyrin repeat-containing protein BDA1 [Ricinus communis]EEF41021.1 protein binding protein, putative [Ricinus communis]|eukprot:XP_025013513.1 ankyrin repeat-containing protein BDA1-like [Ricinus communis]
MEKRTGEEDTTTLYEAAMRGCTETLNSLIQRDRLILNRVSLTSFADTPLHISSLLGHLDFTTAILTQNPKMATRLDSLKRSPLHLASAEGHTEIIKALLAVDNDVCLVRDEDGRIPLHLAAMRGNVEAIQELVSARPDSTSELLEGDTVLHLCVKYNHLEALRLLVETVDGVELVSRGNQDGNTILHLAVMLKQLETIRYLLSVPGVKAGENALNKMGLTALDILDHCPRDFKSAEIRDIIMEAGGGRSTRRIKNPLQAQSAVAITVPRKSSRGVKGWLKKSTSYMQLQGNWIEETQGTLMTVATLIASITFQGAFSPPGGVWQQDETQSQTCRDTEEHMCSAGTAIFAYALPNSHKLFMTYNSISFVASLLVIFLIISGFPLRNKICMWVLTVAMSTTLVFMALTYLISMAMVTPDNILTQLDWIKKTSLFVWLGTVILVSLIHMIRLLTWTSRSRISCGCKQKWWIKSLQKKFQRHQQTTCAEQNPLARV